MLEFIKYIKGPIFALLIGLSLLHLVVLLPAVYFNDIPLMGILNIWSATLVITWGIFLFSQYLRFRQYKSFHKKDRL